MKIRNLIRYIERIGEDVVTEIEHAAGSVIELAEELARPLIGMGHAEEVPAETPITSPAPVTTPIVVEAPAAEAVKPPAAPAAEVPAPEAPAVAASAPAAPAPGDQK